MVGLGCVVGVVAHPLGGVPGPSHALSRGKGNGGGQSTSSTIVAASQHLAPGMTDPFAAPSVAAYLSGAADDVTAAVYDDVTGRTFVYRPGVTQETASVMKVDILATLLAQAQANGQPLTAAQQTLSAAMIEQSDNDAAQDLWDAEGGAAAVGAFNTSAGLTQTTPNAAGYWGLSTTTAADQVQLVRRIAYPNDLLNPASRTYELGLMMHVEADQTWGVSAGVAAGASVALKNGWLPLDSGGWQVNSIGDVDGDGRDYVIAVLTQGASESVGIATIAALSGLIWQELAPSSS